jgi:hypothetical protein
VERVTHDAQKQKAATMSGSTIRRSSYVGSPGTIGDGTKDGTSSPDKTKFSASSPTKITPFEAWQQRQEPSSTGTGRTASGKAGSTSGTKKGKSKTGFTGKEWDNVVENLYRGGNTKYGATNKEQNSGLAEELGNLDFKPKMNPKSLELSRTMKLKPLLERIPKIMEKREELMEKRQQELRVDEDKDCTFQPTRAAANQSNKYLKKSGRDKHKMTPEDLFRYEEEKQRRLVERRKIVRDLEAKEFTFRPKLNAASLKIKAEKETKDAAVTPFKRTSKYDESKEMTILLRQKSILAPVSRVGEESSRVHAGKVFTVESKHPYEHNAHSFQAICLKSALAYSISFDDQSRTEQVFDFIKIYQDDAHQTQWGAGKYNGGINKTPRNFPGTDGRPALLIPASRFVIHFHSNNKVSGWGYKMYITPYYGTINDALGDPTHGGAFQAGFGVINVATHSAGKPQISNRAAAYKDNKGRAAYVRLYEEGKKLQHERHNEFAEQMQRSMRHVEFRPWEIKRGSDVKSYNWTQYKSHTRKSLPGIDAYITPLEGNDGKIYFKAVDFLEIPAPLWKSLCSSHADALAFAEYQDKLAAQGSMGRHRSSVAAEGYGQN